MSADTTPVVTLETPQKAAESARDPRVLALIRFGEGRSPGDGRTPWIDTGLSALGSATPPVQCWRLGTPVRHFREGRFMVHAAPGIAMFAAVLPAQGDPAAAAETLYRELFAVAQTLGCPHLLRIWQYLPLINAPFADEDRYRRFCAGRHQVFESAACPDSALPAACLLGDDGDAVLLYALAAEAPGLQVENPRQVSAFHYPPRYGRAAPSFSRALAKHWPGGAAHLYISGTASVVGHASVHLDTLAQLEETLRNLEVLLAAGRTRGVPLAETLADIAPLTVYLRRAEDYPAVHGVLSQRLPPDHPVVFLRADVCRPELMIEIEGLAGASRPGPGSLE